MNIGIRGKRSFFDIFFLKREVILKKYLFLYAEHFF